MHQHGQIMFGGEGELGAEDRFLPHRVVRLDGPVQPDLPDGNHARVVQQRRQPG